MYRCIRKSSETEKSGLSIRDGTRHFNPPKMVFDIS